MGDKVNLPINAEYTVSVENIKFRLLISEQPSSTSKKYDEKSPLMLHDHVASEIFAAVDGTIEISCEGTDIFLEQGDVAVVPPGLRHAMLPPSHMSEPAVLSFICDRSNARGTSDLYSELKPFFCGDKIAVCRGVPELCKKIKRISMSINERTCIAPAMEAVLVLLETSKTGVCDNVNGGKDAEQYDIKRMMLLDSIIGNYYVKDLKLSDVASQLYISSRQLDRIVRKRYGKSLRKVIMEKRISAAEKILLTTDMTVEQIGKTVGFSTGSSFYREFSAAYGVTPAEYRKKLKNLL